MSNARDLAALASVNFGALATADTVAVGSVTGLGALATKSAVGEADITDGAVTLAKIPDGILTRAKLAAAEQGLLVRAHGVFNGATGALLSGSGLTTSRSGTGAYTVTLSPAAPDTNYTVVTGCADAGNSVVDENSAVARTTSAFALKGRNSNTASLLDVVLVSVSVMW